MGRNVKPQGATRRLGNGSPRSDSGGLGALRDAVPEVDRLLKQPYFKPQPGEFDPLLKQPYRPNGVMPRDRFIPRAPHPGFGKKGLPKPLPKVPGKVPGLRIPGWPGMALDLLPHLIPTGAPRKFLGLPAGTRVSICDGNRGIDGIRRAEYWHWHPDQPNNICVAGQSVGPAQGDVTSGKFPVSTNLIEYQHNTVEIAPGSYRARVGTLLVLPKQVTPFQYDKPKLVSPPVALEPMGDPNLQREMPSAPYNPYGQPSGRVDPAHLPNGQPGSRPAPGAASGTSFTVSTGASSSPSTKTEVIKKPFVPPANPAPPGPGVKERKNRTTYIVLSILDKVSEGAEVVDALFDALPKEVKDRWGNCKPVKSRGLIDQAGQYGIDNADCKLRALWHNWEKVDLEEAVENIVTNVIEDAIAGYAFKRLPRNLGSVGDPVAYTASELADLIVQQMKSYGS